MTEDTFKDSPTILQDLKKKKKDASPLLQKKKLRRQSSLQRNLQQTKLEGGYTREKHNKEEHEIGLFVALLVYVGYGVLIVFGHVRDFFSRFLRRTNRRKGYATLLKDFDDFYTRRLYHRIHDCWNRPITGCAGTVIQVQEREENTYKLRLKLTGNLKECINLGSYNYLGFGNPNSPTKPHVFNALTKYGITTGSSRSNFGTTRLHDDLEKLVARYIGKEDSVTFGMGFATNSTVIPALMGDGGLILSDSLNHSSIVIGCKSSKSKVKTFKHNDMKHLEEIIRDAIIYGQPNGRPWKKILIMVEGIYSMEGEMCPLGKIVELKKKYGCYLWVDEAHSIGAVGANGKGACEEHNVNPADVDVLMGTFTKAFGAVGGYIAASNKICNFIRQHSSGFIHSSSISPPAVQQIISAMKIILGEDGTNLGRTKLDKLKENANYFRNGLLKMGLHVLGDWNSPVAIGMLYNPSKIAAFSRECLRRGVATVVVGFPATPLLTSRARFCLSAGHTKEHLDLSLKIIEEVADVLHLKYANRILG